MRLYKAFLFLFFSVLLSLLSVSCVTYEKCKQKFGNKTDSTYIVVRDTIRVPKDSLIAVFKTVESRRIDTVFRQGRVTVHYVKTPVKTYIRADCDTVTRYITKKIKIPVSNKFGVNPIYKEGFWILLSFAAIIILYIIYVSRKKGSGNSPNTTGS